MQLPTIPKIGRLSRKHKITAAGAAAAAAVVLTVTGLQATGGSSAVAVGDPTGYSVSTGDHVKSLDAKSGMASQKAISDQIAAQKKKAADAVAAKKKAAAQAAAKKKAAAEAAAKRKAAAQAAHRRAAAAAAERARERAAANRSEHRAALARARAAAATPKPAPAPTVTYANNLDGWIRESMAVMAKHNIPGSYNGIYRNIIRESSGNPNAINLWDINAQNGIPSKGLLQVINPTFQTYHVDGTSWNIYDPVANITAACNYAYHVYGTMDNVYSAY
ncbi:transglycosylase SLT domain-containing protein [Streptomyces sp. V4-01]|uniref:Transglycosylase SLT domain-containing protein n=1 Tax=Actinacidiphila polyblastidii TaxID=3110430 RepID=A0ABU7P6C6_9ACTN|nr:transglycosylase SLT domain-containing protein [Streptomyces sp. V4-01]